MLLNSYFEDFLSDIRLTQAQRTKLIEAHTRLRERLLDDEDLKYLIVSVFLQGSYRRATGTRPQGDEKPDVDVVVVTNLKHEDYPNPEDAMDIFVPFLDKYYENKWEKKGRSIGIELSTLKLDLVITSALSEEGKVLTSELIQGYLTPEDAEFRLESEWKTEPLFIPDREARNWQRTHPLEQIKWTIDKNRNCEGHYVNIVKAIKWWWNLNYPDLKYPKGYPLEHMVGDCCQDGVTSMAVGLTQTLEEMTDRWNDDVLNGQVPFLADRGVPEHNVLARLISENFSAFHRCVREASFTARQALDSDVLSESVSLWQELFGTKFPSPPKEDSSSDVGTSAGGFTPRNEPTSQVGGGRFA